MLLTLRGIYELARLAVLSGFRMKGAYWTWRKHTALGPGGLDAVSPAAQRHAALEYGRWIARMKG